MKLMLKAAMVTFLSGSLWMVSAGQRTPAERPKSEQASRAEQAEEQEWTRYAECVSAAVRKAAEKRQEMVRQGKNPSELRGIFSLWHGRRKTHKDCPQPGGYRH